MKIYSNETLYRRNEQLGLITNLGGIALIMIAVFVLFNTPGQLGRYFLFLLGGIILIQAGMYFGRMGKRADLSINKSLKSLDNNYSIYHHMNPIQHLLVGPSGSWIIIPRHTKGMVSYNAQKQKWEIKDGNFFGNLWRWLTQEKLGRPHFEAMIEADSLDRLLEKKWTSKEQVHVHAVAVFLDSEIILDVGEAPFPAVALKKLKQVVTKNDHGKSLTNASLKQLNSILQE